MRTARVLLLGSLAVALADSASAASTAPGASILAIQVSRGVADLASGGPTGVTWFNHPEVGMQAQYWYFLRQDYGVNLSAGIGYFKLSDSEPPGFGSSSFQRTISSWHVGLGGDRFAKVSDKLVIFAGPGLQVWGGKFKDEDDTGEAESPSALRLSLTGRIGAHILMGENFGLIGHLGQYWGYMTAEEGEASTKSLPSGTEGAMGFSFGF